MERENKKRAREEEEKDMSVPGKRQEVMSPEGTAETIELSDSANSAEVGVFQFPWEDENLVLDGWKSGDEAFYSSLLDAATGELPVEGLCHGLSPPPVMFPGEKMDDHEWWPSEEETEGLDCIWSSVLSQPLSITGPKASTSPI